jgi:hypothetical protein
LHRFTSNGTGFKKSQFYRSTGAGEPFYKDGQQSAYGGKAEQGIFLVQV